MILVSKCEVKKMDNHTPEQRRKNMQAIKSKNSKIELTLIVVSRVTLSEKCKNSFWETRHCF